MVVIQNHLVSILSTIIGPISVNDTNIRGPQEMTNDTSDCGIFHHTAASPTGQTFHLSMLPRTLIQVTTFSHTLRLQSLVW